MKVIIDTDLSLYWDDATALGMANVVQERGRIGIFAIVSDVKNPVAVAAIDAIDTAYGDTRIPLGTVVGTRADTRPARLQRQAGCGPFSPHRQRP